jgi:hypothetical protein
MMNDPTLSHLLTLIPLGLGLAAGAGFIALTAWRPAIACSLFALLIPLTTGLGRGTIVPVLRPNEAILLMLLIGLGLYHLCHPRRRPVTGLDVAIGSYTIGTVLIAVLVLVLSRTPGLTDLDTLRGVLAPLQLLAVYLVFSRIDLSSSGLRAALNLTMVASIIVSVLAVLELVLPSARSAIEAVYPPPAAAVGWDPLYRPISTLGHYAAVGAFGTLNYTLALGLATHRHAGFPRPWLVLVMIVNLAGLVASLTWAPLLVLPFVTGAVLLHGRRLPGELAATGLALALAFAVLWPAVSARGDQQGVLSGGGGVAVPQTFDFRVRHWQEFFLPALLDHVWVGTGTVLPSEVPVSLDNFVDNEYLREGFRAGLAGLTLLLIMVGTISLLGWRDRASPDPTRQMLGGVSLAMGGFFLLVGLTGEYLYFAGVSQEFAMIVGLAGAVRLAATVPAARRSARRPEPHRLAIASP